jgi:hypothetical protein
LAKPNLIEQIIGGLGSGFFAGMIGYATDLAVEAMFEAFKSFNPLFIVFGALYAIVSFTAGTKKAYVAGVSFSVGIIAAGYVLSDFVTIVSGVISIVGTILSFKEIQKLLNEKIMRQQNV